MDILHEKPLFVTPTSSSNSAWNILVPHTLVSKIANVFSTIQSKRSQLELTSPGTFEFFNKEVDKDVFLTRYSFSGLRADINKAFSPGNPMFQASHSFAMGSELLSPYNFNVVYGTSKTLMQGSIDNDKSVTAQFNWRWNQSLITKCSAQIVQASLGQSGFAVENEYTGDDFTANIKGTNLSFLQGPLTGIVTAEYLQSITPRLALGLTTEWVSLSPDKGPMASVSYAARYKTSEWMGTARYTPMYNKLHLSYWRKLGEVIQVGVQFDFDPTAADTASPFAGGTMLPKPKTTIGARYDFPTSVFRAQVNTKGQVAAFLEKRINQAIGLTFVGQIDHMKNEAKVGLSISLEQASPEVMEQQQRLMELGEVTAPPV